MSLKSLIPLVAVLTGISLTAPQEPLRDTVNVRDFGAKGDAKADDTAAFQRAMDEVGKAGGGTVQVPRGNYFFKGNLNVPNAVTLQGIWQSVPAHTGIRDKDMPKP